MAKKSKHKCNLPEWEVMTITPTMAEEFLEKNTINRPIRDSRVNKYIRELQAGYWEVNGESIKFAKDGRLLDGQHRLWACVLSGVSMRIDVRRNLSPGSQSTMDQGGDRSGSDVLGIKEVPNAKEVAAALQHIYRYCNGKSKQNGVVCNKVQLIDYYHRFPEISDSATVARKCQRLIPAGIGTALHFIFRKISKEKADAFFRAMATGEYDVGMAAVRFYRERLIKSEMTATRRRDKLPALIKTALCIKAWNAFYEETGVRVIRYGDNDSFPTIAGMPKKVMEAFKDDHCYNPTAPIKWPDGKRPGAD